MTKHFLNRQNDNPPFEQERAFATAFAAHGDGTRAAISAGYPARYAFGLGISLLGNERIIETILSIMREQGKVSEAEAFEAKWGQDLSDPLGWDFVAAIDAKREALAYASRGNLPLPSEVVITRPKLSARQARRQRHHSKRTRPSAR